MNRILCGLLVGLAAVVISASAAESPSKAGPLGEAQSPLALLTAFTYPGDPAARDIEASLRFALGPEATLDVYHANSAHDAAAACEILMGEKSPLRLLIFAGDEGAATAVALLSEQYKMPVLKLTSDARSSTRFSRYLFEFLPSMETQARELAKYAARAQRMESCLILSADDARGRSLADGFRKGAEAAKSVLLGEQFYAPESSEIRREANLLLTSEARMSHRGRTEVALSPQERAELFGDAQNGEVLFAAANADSATEERLPVEGFFCGILPNRGDACGQQLPVLPAGTILLGNSSWANLEALDRQQMATEGMYVSLPLVPRAADPDVYWDAFEESRDRDATDWERLGYDAGKFLGRVFEEDPGTRQEIVKRLSGEEFTGRAVRVDFTSGRENTAVRIVRYLNHELQLVH